MELTKYLKTKNSSYILNNVKIINDFILTKGFIQNNFYLDLSFDDEKVLYQNYQEFIDSLPINNGRHFLLHLYFYKPDDEKIEINITIQGRENHSFSIKSKNKDYCEKIANELAKELKLNFYKYNPIAEKKKEIKEETNKCVSVLEKFSEYHLRRSLDIKNEKDVQNFLYPILKSHFSDLEDEFYLPQYANISYKPDFGIPYLKLLIEVKFIRHKTDLKKIQKEINDDSVGYIRSSDKYKKIITFIYNSKNIPIPTKYIKDLEKNKSIEKIIISSGINIK